MPHLSPMSWYFISEFMLLSVVLMMTVIWWESSVSLSSKVVFKGNSGFKLPWE